MNDSIAAASNADVPSRVNRIRSRESEDSSSCAGDDESNPSKKIRRSGIKHASQACDACKARKGRCDEVRPVCGFCSAKKLACTRDKEDGRKGKGTVGSLRDRIDTLVDLLSNTRANPGGPEKQSPNVDSDVNAPIPSTSGPQISASPSATSHSSNLIAGPSIALPSALPGAQITFPLTHTTHIEDVGNSMDIFQTSDNVLDQTRGKMQQITGSLPDAMSRTSPAEPWNNTLPMNEQATQIDGSSFTTNQGSQVTVWDRLKRPETGSLMQFGPTSLWSYTPDTNDNSITLPASTPVLDLRPGDWIDWARALPSDLNISKAVHDAALSFFGAYYAPWCMVVDMPAFMHDLETCNLVTRIPPAKPPPLRTATYSPLLHNCALYIGLHLRRDQWPDVAQAMDTVMDKHCASLIMGEIEEPSTSTLRALNIFATCLNVRKDNSARNSGYIYFGMAFAAVQALGVNLNCDQLVVSGQITMDERDMRNNAYWTIYQQDLLRAIATGRPPMLNAESDVPLPKISPAADTSLWYSNHLGKIGAANGLAGMTSTVFHWSSKLHRILRRIMETPLYSVISDCQDRDSKVLTIAREIEDWIRDQPFSRPTLHPVPHVLVMHMMYHLTTIYLFRPYFRSHLDITPLSADRCRHAATTTAELLRVYEAEHGLRNGVATLIPIVFATATVILLVLASGDLDGLRHDAYIQALDEAVWFMSQLALSWIEARRGLQVINTLRTEWLIDRTQVAGDSHSQVEQSMPTLSEELPKELHEWLLSTSFYDILQGNKDSIPGVGF